MHDQVFIDETTAMFDNVFLSDKMFIFTTSPGAVPIIE